MKPSYSRKIVLRPSSSSKQKLIVMKTNKSVTEIQVLFIGLIEQTFESILPFLDSWSLSQFRKVSRVTFYHVQSYQVWNMMLGDINVDKKIDLMKSSQISTQQLQMKSSQVSTQKSTNSSDLQESQLEKQSYLKNSFYSKFDPLSRPSTQQKGKRQDTQQNQIWLKKPLNYDQLVSQGQASFLQKKNLIEPNSLFMNDDDLKNIVDIWIMNMKQLQGQVKLESFETDSLVQEVTIWVEVVKLINNFDQEFKEEHVAKICQALNSRQILDLSIQKKYKTFNQIKNLVLENIQEKNQFASFLEQKLKTQLQNLTNSKLLKFFELQGEFFRILDQIFKNDQFVMMFSVRAEHLFMKLCQSAVEKIKSVYFKLSWIVEFNNLEQNVQIMEKFIAFFISLIKRHEYSGQFIKQELSKYKHQQNAKYLEHVKKVVSDILKMTKLNHKLKLQVQKVAFFELYDRDIDPFDLFDLSSVSLWKEAYNSWKSKYHQAKSQGQGETTIEDVEEQTQQQDGFFQSTVSWNIS